MTHSDPDSLQNMPEPQSAHEVTRILQSIKDGDEQTHALIPLLYNELRHVAANRLALERPGQTLQATALVHEAYMRLIQPNANGWQDRRHFMGAAAEAMRRILIDSARRKKTQKRGEVPHQMGMEILNFLPANQVPSNVLDLNEALEELEVSDPEAAELIKLRFFAGMTLQEISQAMDVSLRKSNSIWAFAKTWLYRRLKKT